MKTEKLTAVVYFTEVIECVAARGCVQSSRHVYCHHVEQLSCCRSALMLQICSRSVSVFVLNNDSLIVIMKRAAVESCDFTGLNSEFPTVRRSDSSFRNKRQRGERAALT